MQIDYIKTHIMACLTPLSNAIPCWFASCWKYLL